MKENTTPQAKRVNPKSLMNLTYHDGRPPKYDSVKNRHSITVTEEGWAGAASLAKQMGCSSISDLIEMIGRAGAIIVLHDARFRRLAELPQDQREAIIEAVMETSRKQLVTELDI